MNLLPRQIYLVTIIVIEIILSLYIGFTSASPDSTFCVFGGHCSEVQNSIYGSIFGIKISWLGAGAFTLLLLTYILSIRKEEYRKYFIAAVTLGGLGSLTLLFIQFFVLRKVCSSCLIVDTLMLVIVVLALIDYRKARKTL